MRALLALLLAASAAPAAAQVVFLDDPVAALRLENELRYQQGQQRAFEAELGRFRTEQTVRRLQTDRLPDPIIENRAALQETVEAEALRRAQQAQSTERAARLRSGLAAFGYADSLPLNRR